VADHQITKDIKTTFEELNSFPHSRHDETAQRIEDRLDDYNQTAAPFGFRTQGHGHSATLVAGDRWCKRTAASVHETAERPK
jgi:hypothetical protein